MKYWYETIDVECEKYISVVPSERQLKYSREMKYYNFIHFGVNTFTDREWGDGTEDEKIFAPDKLNTDQWCGIIKKSGSSGVIITAKHHDGFCLFDSKYTDHTVMNSSYPHDIIKMLSESTKKYGLKLGIYLSPWDRHEKTYGTDKYNDFFVNQLTELCQNYGEIFCFWFDGACGEGANGKKQVYDWERYWSVIRKYQPNAVISVCGPDVRWIGNEAGKTRESEYNVISWANQSVENTAKKSQHSENRTGKLTSFDRTDEDIGSREKIKGKTDLVWYPAEADLSMTSGWFYHDDDYYKNPEHGFVKTPSELADVYFNTVYGNASMLLNIPVDRHGLISEREKTNLEKFSETVKNTFKEEVTFNASALNSKGETRKLKSGEEIILKDDEAVIRIYPDSGFSKIIISEDISFSQRVENFTVVFNDENIESTTIGTGKIIRLSREIKENHFDIIFNSARGNPVIEKIKLYK